MRFILSLTLTFLLSFVTAQDTIPYYVLGKEYEIHTGMNEQRKSEFLNAIDAADIEVSPFTRVEFPVRVTFKDGKQNLMRYGEVEFIAEKHLDSIAFITKESREIGITFGKYKGEEKFVFTSSYTQEINKGKDSWDKIEWRNKDQFARGIKDMENGEPYGNFPIAEFYVKQDDKWGVVGLTENWGLQVFVPVIYDRKEQITLKYWPTYYTPDFRKIRKKHKIDLIEPLKYKDDFYLVRHRKKKKWGVVAVRDDYELIIDAKYDSVTSLKDQHAMLLWEDSYVGVSNESGKILYPVEYDDYKLINLDYMFGIALKQENEWSLYSLHESKKLIEKQTETADELIDHWLNR